MADTQLAKIKRRLGISVEDTNQDVLINDLVSDAESYFKLITGAKTINEQYSFIVRDVALKLYVRKGSEGAESESVDGYSVSYAKSLFEEYMPLLERDFNLTDDGSKRGKVYFY